MARLVLPSESLAFPCRKTLLGSFSPVPLRENCSVDHFQNTARRNIKFGHFNASQAIFQKHGPFYSSLPRIKQVSRRQICSVATEDVAQLQQSNTLEQVTETFLKDYKEPDYYFDTVDLKFELDKAKTRVSSKISVVPRIEGSSPPLVLDGLELSLVSIKINGNALKEEDYYLDASSLTIQSPPSGEYTLEVVTEIEPEKNTTFMGLYHVSDSFCTYLEPQGFRKITYFQDRPDVMAKYTVRLEADKSLYPVLLSNGNLLEQGDLEGGRHYATWKDPFKKPCYLFALVAGVLQSTDDTFTTRSGKTVSIRIWTPPEDASRTAHAMFSVKNAMKWDEETFGREYDLDLFNVVAVPYFSSGAMENKSLNIFNSRFVLASPETATDADYAQILNVVGHEYFHNWTGDRVTLRDWFQLTLKEGLTVFRDQEFSSDMGSRSVKRIVDATQIRSVQFSEDAGPMAHPIRPESYIKIDNFYTVTVYQKGAEVTRMYKTILGSERFRKGMDLYFKRHDGQAITCEDFFAAMRDANDENFENFFLWYSQAGTPVVKVNTSYNPEAHTYSLKFSQEIPPTPGQEDKEPMFIPVAIGLLDSTGKDIPLSAVYQNGTLKSVSNNGNPVSTAVLRFTQKEEEFVFTDIVEKPVPSLLREFSAPVRLESDLTNEDFFFLLANDHDEFNRWEVGQFLAQRLMLSLANDIQKQNPLVLNPKFIEGFKLTLLDSSLDKALRAQAITLPSFDSVMMAMEVADPDAAFAAWTFTRKQLASALKAEFLSTIEENQSSDDYVFDHPNAARRNLKNVALDYIASLADDNSTKLVLQQYNNATNMTDEFAAFTALAQNPGETRDFVLDDFYKKWQNEQLLVNQWFSVQAKFNQPGNVENVRKLLQHPAFNIQDPNQALAVIGGFLEARVNFHAMDGSGYDFVGENLIIIDQINPAIASRMATGFSKWKRFNEHRQNLQKAQLQKIMNTNGISPNLFEVASKSLNG